MRHSIMSPVDAGQNGQILHKGVQAGGDVRGDMVSPKVTE